jgi:hypothetical protein
MVAMVAGDDEDDQEIALVSVFPRAITSLVNEVVIAPGPK